MTQVSRDDLEPALITPRLVLEPLVRAHARDLFALLQDERLYRYYNDAPPRTIETLEQRYEAWAARKSPDGTQTWLNYAVRLKNEGYVGWVQATIASSTAIIGYDIFPHFWRQGYATEAITALINELWRSHHVAVVAATVDTENVASIRLLERLGFVRAWAGPSEDMPGRQDYRYELRRDSGSGLPIS